MSKKTKKTQAQVVENPEVTNQTAQENETMEVTQADVEVIPSTIVEGYEAEVFSGQTEGQEVEATSEGESHAVEGPVVVTGQETQPPVEQTAQPEQPEEKPAPKPRVNKRPYISLVESHLELGDLDRKSLLELVLKEFPAVTKGGITTFITDLKNPKYSHFKPRVAVEHPTTKKFLFADKLIPAVIVAEQGQEVEQTETQLSEAEVPAADVAPVMEVPVTDEPTEQPNE